METDDPVNEYNGNQPHDAMAEMSVLGEAMRNGKVSAEVSALIAPTDMYRPILQQIAQICWDLTDKDVSCNPVTVLDEYRRRRLPTSEIHVVAELAGFGHPGTHHARIIRECAARRRLIATADRLAQLAVAPEMDPWDTAASVSVTTGQLAENADPIKAVADGSGQSVEDLTGDAACLGIPGFVPELLDGALALADGESVLEALERGINMRWRIAPLLQRKCHAPDVGSIHHRRLGRVGGVGTTCLLEKVLDLVDAVATTGLADAGEGCTHATIVPYAWGQMVS